MKYIRALVNLVMLPSVICGLLVLAAIEAFDYSKEYWRHFGDKWFWEWLG